MNKILEKDKFIENQTIIYHKHYGEGYFKSFPEPNRIKIEFPNDGEKIFEYPTNFDDVLSLEKTYQILEQEQKEADPYYYKENKLEQEHFDKIKQITYKNLMQAIDEEYDKKTEYNDYSSSRNQYLFQEHQQLLATVDKCRRIDNEPYFARVDYNSKNENIKTLYIGKEEIPGQVISWTAPESSMYYLYRIHSADISKNPLKLVRDFDIRLGKYFSFFDKLNRYQKKESTNFEEDIIADNRLLNIINQNKSSKKVHDIIESIQVNQYKMIIHDANANILILGCAGSGKTMIMLHRLSFMALNKKLSLKNTFVISPTNLLNLELNELSTNLNINQSYRYSSLELNQRLVQKYYLENKVEYEKEPTNKETQYNFDIPSNIVKIIYSKDFITIFKNKLYKLLDTTSKESKAFIDKKLDEIINKFNITNLKDKYQLLNQRLFTEQENTYLEYLQMLKAVSITNVNDELKKLKQTKIPNQGAIDRAEAKKLTLLMILKYNKNLLQAEVGSKISHEKIYRFFTIIKDIYDVDDIENCDYVYYQNEDGTKTIYKRNDNGTITKELKKNFKKERQLEFLKLYNLINQYNQFEKERNLLREYAINNNTRIYFDYILNDILDEAKKAAEIENNSYEYETFFKLYACSLIFKQVIPDKKHIFIDEIQDYSLLEIETYKKVFPKSIFNYYGDINQNINPKGMLSEEIYKLTTTNNIFSINENYRNAKEITEYINKRFNMNMIPIGLEGKIEISTLTNIKNTIKPNNDDRIAIIVKNKEIADKYLKDFNDVNNLFYNKLDISKEKINIMSIMLAKGLEFEKVIVIEEKMTKNELYVAFTRALNELYIINN